jgi:small-conductance mechanosensitive channel
MSDNERFYTINKALNITFFTLLIFTLLFAYIENVSYLVTILGFASAGIAIAMKDWFMSIMGWFVIVIGGAVHVGDRVKFVRNGMEYLGDVIDISMLRMTIQEDISLTTYMHNRRAGRIIFVPNNFIFTDMVANYTHAGLKTVWDGIDFTITFDSNAQRAAQIAKEVTKKYSKGYTEITRKQLNKLRSQYSVKNTNVEPRIYTFIEPNGVRISAWYHTNAYATLTLRSTISMEILEKIQAEDSITMAYPTQSIYINKDVRKPKLPPTDDEGVV